MQCQHCHIHEATFHYRSNINGQISEQHLCADCAQNLEGGLFAHTPTGPMEALFGGGLFGAQPFFAPVRPRSERSPSHIPAQNPGPQKDGVPPEAADALKQRRARNALRQELQRAVETENFERAAELRDEIHRMEQ